jgi:8-oxo-dGTP pyrophosphatase MutT (NUDIX family)
MPIPDFVVELRATGAVREVLEETGVRARADRLVSTSIQGPVTHANGDLATYLDLTFACTWLEGEPFVADDESTGVRWCHRGALPDMGPALRWRVDAALSTEREARFLR